MNKGNESGSEMVVVLDEYRGQIGKLPEVMRSDAILWIEGLKTAKVDFNIEILCEFMGRTWGVVEHLPPGVQLTALRYLMCLHGDDFLKGSPGVSESFGKDLTWINTNVAPIMVIGVGAPRLMRMALAKHFVRLSGGDITRIGISIIGQVIASAIIIAKRRTIGIDETVALEGLALLLAAWLIGKCKGVDRDLWNDIMAGFTLFSIVFPFLVNFFKNS